MVPKPEPGPRKPILAALSVGHGDGGSEFDLNWGDTPLFILYADGQLLVRAGREGLQNTYVQGRLSESQTCGFLLQLQDTGILSVRGDGRFGPFDRIYAKVNPQSPGGGPGGGIAVNGYPSRTLSIYLNWVDVMVDEVKRAYLLLRNYPVNGLQPYVSDRAVVRIRPIDEDPYWKNNYERGRWPSDFPPAAILARMANAEGDLELIGPMAAKIVSLAAGDRVRRYADRGTEYIVAARQLLPHETIESSLRPLPMTSSIEDLPRCAYRPDLAIPTPTPGPADDEWLWQRKVDYSGPQVALEAPAPRGSVVANWHGFAIFKGQSGQDFGRAYRYMSSAGRTELVDFYKSTGKPADMRFRGMITDTYDYVPSQNESIRTLANGRLLFSRAENGVEKAWVVIHIRPFSPSNEVAILEYDKMPFTSREMANLNR